MGIRDPNVLKAISARRRHRTAESVQPDHCRPTVQSNGSEAKRLLGPYTGRCSHSAAERSVRNLISVPPLIEQQARPHRSVVRSTGTPISIGGSHRFCNSGTWSREGIGRTDLYMRQFGPGGFKEPFGPNDVRRTCPGWARSHLFCLSLKTPRRQRNPGGTTELFQRIAPGRYRTLTKLHNSN